MNLFHELDPDTRRIVAVGIGIVAVVVLVLGLWGAMAPLQGAIVTKGLVKSENNLRTVRHAEGGIVKQIMVHDGDRVAKGQPLLILEDVNIDASFTVAREMLAFELVRQERFEAERLGLDHFDAPRVLDIATDPHVLEEARKKETQIFTARHSSLEGQLALLRQQVDEVDSEHKALLKQVASVGESAKYIGEELRINERLAKKGNVPEVQLLTLRRQRADYIANMNEQQAAAARALQRRDDYQLRIITARSEFQRNAAEELKSSATRILELREKLRASADASKRQTVLSPVAGRVVGLQVHTIGAALGPRDPMMDIVPEGEVLLVSARTNVDSINELHIGQLADIRFTTFKSRTTPLVAGHVSYVSASALADSNGAPYYEIEVVPDADSLRQAGIKQLQSGMAAEMFIKTKSRTALDYLLAPIADYLSRALRET